MQLYLHNTLLATPHVGLITTFTCITLPEHYTDISMEVQHSCPNLLLVEPSQACTLTNHSFVLLLLWMVLQRFGLKLLKAALKQG